ncbi:MAG: IS1182 family transposase [Flavobacteriaceae bacterium]|nr:IS1182 family transposase [Flavobacteriaceae bacterium]
MQGKKNFTPKLFVNFRLDEAVPNDNFYKILKKHLNLNFIYKETKAVYSHTGRPGIDPIVFFKMLLVGYLENICTDRKLEREFQNRLDLRFFIDHDLGDTIPDHSTICKTRKRIPREVFDKVFDHILKLCIDAGLVGGKTQSIDSAYINANASLDRMQEVKLIDRDHDEYLREVFDQDLPDNFTTKDKIARVNKLQKDLEMHAKGRKKKYDAFYGPNRKNSRRTFSNATHRSSTDPDARVAKKSGKPRMLCYTSTMSVDTKSNVITNITAEHASKKDSQLLIRNVIKTMGRLKDNGLYLEQILADAGFSSGENYALLEQMGIEAFIPLHGTYETHREAFKYDGRRNAFTCENGQILKPSYTKFADGKRTAVYRSKKVICDKCPFRINCVNKKGIKEITSTPYKKEYERMIKRLKSQQGKISYGLRMHTVEPVFGSLQQYYGLRRMNVRGKNNASKVMLMSAAAFNLKKWMKKVINDSINGLYSMFLSLRAIKEYLILQNKKIVFLNS